MPKDEQTEKNNEAPLLKKRKLPTKNQKPEPSFHKEADPAESGFLKNYRSFRRGGLGWWDSFFNSLYILVYEKSAKREEKRREKKGKDASELNLWSLHSPLLRLFSWFSRLFSSSGKEKHRKEEENSFRTVEKKKISAYLLPAFALVLVFLAVFYVGSILRSPVVYCAQINGETVAFVDDWSMVESSIRELEDNVAIVLGENFHFPYEVHYLLSNHESEVLTEKKAISETLYGMIREFICTAGGLYVDDTLVAVCQDAETIETVLQDFVRENMQSANGEEAGIFNEISVVTQAYPTGAIISDKELRALLEEMRVPLDERNKADAPEPPAFSGGVTNTEKPAVPNMSLVADTQLVSDPDRSFRSNQPQPIDNIKLDFYTVRYEHYDAVIPYETVYVESNLSYTSMANINQNGVDGVSAVVAKVYFVEGKEALREIVSETVKKKSVERIIAIGTKVLPEEQGITDFYQGRFILPRIWERGILDWPYHPEYSKGYSSDYGWRSDPAGYHRGVDIPGNRGDALYAAASGTVVVAIGQDGYQSWRPQNSYNGFGYCVVIEHEDGFQTLYAHCSRINVTLGQEVKQGEKIAEVGSTGDSDGNHVHFEVILNDVRVNPNDYLYQGNKTIYDDKK